MDPAIIAALDVPVPPWRPQVVEERAWVSPQVERARISARKHAEAYERYADEWLARIEGVYVGFEKSFDHSRVDNVNEATTHLTELIEWRESEAEQRAANRSRLAKASARLQKRLFKQDPGLGAVERDFAARLLRTDDRIIEGLLDYALFLRAVRADISPDRGTGPTFDDPEALGAYLRTAVS